MQRANPYTSDMSARDVTRTTVIDHGSFAFGVNRHEKEKAETAF